MFWGRIDDVACVLRVRLHALYIAQRSLLVLVVIFAAQQTTEATPEKLYVSIYRALLAHTPSDR